MYVFCNTFFFTTLEQSSILEVFAASLTFCRASSLQRWNALLLLVGCHTTLSSPRLRDFIYFYFALFQLFSLLLYSFVAEFLHGCGSTLCFLVYELQLIK